VLLVVPIELDERTRLDELREKEPEKSALSPRLIRGPVLRSPSGWTNSSGSSL
jgi:hypothetical protein